jgi:hypothetical protein
VSERKEPIILSSDEVRSADATYRREGDNPPLRVVRFNMPPNEKSESLQEGDEVIYNGGYFRVYIKEDRRPPSVSERVVDFWLVSPSDWEERRGSN